LEDKTVVEIPGLPGVKRQAISSYRILECLGGGAMGVVYKAEDTRLGRTVALKFLPAELTRDLEAKERFLQEARLASSLDHPNLCTIYEAGETESGQLYLSMAFYDGENLKKRIERGPLPVADAVEIAAQIANGLARAHGSGIIHRDVKPANVMLTSRGEVKLVDFGLAKLTGELGVSFTQAGALMGTPAYMSPEQAQGKPVDTRTDVWSLGVVLYESLTGMRPFAGEAWQAVIQAVIHQTPEAVRKLRPEVPPALDRIVQRCLAKKPADRYPTIEALAADLNSLRGPGLSSFGSWSHTVAPVPWRREPPWHWIALGGLMVFLILAAGLYFALRPIPEAELPTRPAQPVAGAPVPDGRQMIVVLPFENLGAPEDAYFAEGITEEITSRLAAIQGLRVISRTSANQYRGTTKSLSQIGRELKVDYVLDGSVRWEHSPSGPSRVRVTPKLIRVSEDSHLWSERYDREIDEIFKVQSEIAEKVIAQLNVTLEQAEREVLLGHPTDSHEAWQVYRQGRSKLDSLVPRNEQDGLEAVALFEQALEIDPEFALAAAWLSRAHSGMHWAGLDVTKERLDLAKQAAERALALQPELPEARLALGYYYYWGHRAYDPALEQFEMVGRARPNDTEVLTGIGYIRRRQGKFEQALDYLKKALVLDPRNAALASNVGNTHTMLRQYPQAQNYYDLALSIDPQELTPYIEKSMNFRLWKGEPQLSREVLEKAPPGAMYLELDWIEQSFHERRFDEALRRIQALPFDFVRNQEQVYPKVLLEAHAYRYLGQRERARQAYGEAYRLLAAEVRLNPGDPRLQSSMGLALAGLGHREEAMKAGGLAVELSPVGKDAVSGAHRLIELAKIYALVGAEQPALDHIDVLLGMPAPLSAAMLRSDPMWDPLRDNPRFQAIAGPPRVRPLT
jgi:TolB-like protein